MASSSTFKFQQFTIKQDQCAMKVGIDSVLLGAWVPTASCRHILDIGTGTGILALMMAQRTKATIDAVEIETNAFHQATDNFQTSSFYDRILSFNTSIQNFKSKDRYDLIISNPPYFENSLKSDNALRNAVRHNDTLNLDDLFSHSARLLSTQGRLAIILPHSCLNNAKETAQKYQLYCACLTEVKGKRHKSPNRILLLFQKKITEIQYQQITIYESDGKYTQSFQELTKDFYLPSIFR